MFYWFVLLVCFPGFLEDIRYFIALYRDVPARIIVLNNGNYQNPFTDDTAVTKPAWVASNPYPLGTIAHDAYCLNLVLENMTSKERVVLHGHSRGGSVVLEAGHQKPDRASNTEALLEAAVVPQGRLVNKGESLLQPVGFYLMPLILSLLRILPESMRLKSPMMWVTNAAKNKHVAAIPEQPLSWPPRPLPRTPPRTPPQTRPRSPRRRTPGVSQMPTRLCREHAA